MDLKRQNQNMIAKQKSDQELRDVEYEESLIRSDEDWKIIDDYLYSLIIKNSLKLDRYCPELVSPVGILLTNNKKLRINHKDIERFCRHHHFGIRYINKLDYDKYEESFYYDNVRTRFYLLKG